ncbi:Aste57867_18187 [Aphanomyces stellatus]|uniref:Aste57867_18187 protein n=1 Tax=Aphanomyces stellatus TaxID=120398 RepID=A0A485LB12_9STRA|nr:hypothetical protein As57867_018125 [Aphanomyces stellatus]VFT94925.1 Aste57867_18187 [Aphanomyces stellatus]
MAWFSSGSTNDELAMALKGHDIIKSKDVLDAFRTVDRAHFVPRNMVSRAYKDYPIREGNVHLSAPHIYAQVMEALELTHGVSFLNIGSGSGYLSCLVGAITGKDAINHGLEIDGTVVQACRSSLEMYMSEEKTPPVQRDHNNQDDEIYNDDVEDELDFHSDSADEEPEDAFNTRKSDVGVCEVVCGDAFRMDTKKNVKYDRIYIGAGAPERMIDTVKELLNPFGIAVGPFGDKLLKIRRRDANRFSEVVLGNVTFAPMRENTTNNAFAEPITYFPPQVWAPYQHGQYPRRFKEAVAMLLTTDSHLPTTLWLRVFEYFSHDWFNEELSATEKLRVLLEIETNAREEAEKRALKAENERDKFRLLLWRQQNQIQHLMARLSRGESSNNGDVDQMEDDEDLSSADEVENEDMDEA